MVTFFQLSTFLRCMTHMATGPAEWGGGSDLEAKPDASQGRK